MTTTVKIEANCGDDKEVFIQIVDAGMVTESCTIDDGESDERYIYGLRVLSVSEQSKKPE